MFDKLNTRRTVNKDIDTTGMEFKALKEFCGQQIKVDGFFFNTSEYGKQVVVVGNGYLINMPKRAVEQFEKIEASDKMIKAMFEGHCLIDNIKMKETKNGTTTIFEFVDI